MPVFYGLLCLMGVVLMIDLQLNIQSSSTTCATGTNAAGQRNYLALKLLDGTAQFASLSLHSQPPVLVELQPRMAAWARLRWRHCINGLSDWKAVEDVPLPEAEVPEHHRKRALLIRGARAAKRPRHHLRDPAVGRKGVCSQSIRLAAPNKQ